MAIPSRTLREITAGDLSVWLKDVVAPVVREPTAALPHGGTALTLLSLKGSTKEVDFGFTSSDDFERFMSALKKLDYKITIDTKATPNEQWVRMESSRHLVDAVDLRWPTWNNWRRSGLMLKGALQIPFGNVTLTLLDKNAIFLFKTYPLRDTDFADLRTVLDVTSIDGDRATSLFEEQDLAHRKDLGDPDIAHEPLINILELRVRAAGSCHLIGPGYRNRIRGFANHVAVRFRELGLKQKLPEMVEALRVTDGAFSWDEPGIDFEALRKRLTVVMTE